MKNLIIIYTLFYVISTNEAINNNLITDIDLDSLKLKQEHEIFIEKYNNKTYFNQDDMIKVICELKNINYTKSSDIFIKYINEEEIKESDYFVIDMFKPIRSFVLRNYEEGIDYLSFINIIKSDTHTVFIKKYIDNMVKFYINENVNINYLKNKYNLK